MSVKKTYKVRLEPNNKQLTQMLKTAGCVRFAYNWILGKCFDAFNNKTEIDSLKFRREFTDFKNQNTWLYDVSNAPIKQAQKDALSAFSIYLKSFKNKSKQEAKNKAINKIKSNKYYTNEQRQRHLNKAYKMYQPHFKCKHNKYKSFAEDVNPKTFSISETHIRLTKIGYIRLSETNRIPVGAKYYNPRITFDGFHWYISVAVDVDIQQNHNTSNGIGIDLGIKDLAILSDGTKFENINKSLKIKKLLKKKKRLQHQCSHKYLKNLKKGKYYKTNNIIKLEHIFLKLEKRLTNIRTDHINKTLSTIINRKPKFITIEDLNISGMMKNKKIAKHMQNSNLYYFRQMLTSKCHEHNIELRCVDRFYPSSQICSCCGTIHNFVKNLSIRKWTCLNCKITHDRDVNAAINLKNATNYKVL